MDHEAEQQDRMMEDAMATQRWVLSDECHVMGMAGRVIANNGTVSPEEAADLAYKTVMAVRARFEQPKDGEG